MVETLRRGAQKLTGRNPAPDLTSGGSSIDPLASLGFSETSDNGAISMRRFYEAMELYAAGNALYDVMQAKRWTRGTLRKGVRSLMTPGSALVEFFAATVWAGANAQTFVVETDDEEEIDELKESIEGIFEASNWGDNKQVAVRSTIRLGDTFLKSCQRESDGYPYIQVIHPWFVGGNFEVNERGNLTYIRLDMPQEQADANGRTLIITEVWDKELGTYRQWEHYEDLDTPEEKLGEPDVEDNMEETYGFDFIPFVHLKARSTGEKYGQPPILPALDKIDELNTLVTELDDDLFRHNRAKYAISSNMLDADNRPVFPPDIYNAEGEIEVSQQTINGEEIFILPGLAGMTAMGSGIDWDAKGAQVDKLYTYLMNQDLPHLRWYTLSEQGAMSGVAILRYMAPAVSSTLEVRGNLETALIKAIQMCITMGQLARLTPFTILTAWGEGGLRFHFSERDVIPMSEEELADTDTKRQQANALMIANGYTQRWVMIEEDHMDEGDVDDMLAEQAATAGPTPAQDALTALAAEEIPPAPGALPGEQAAEVPTTAPVEAPV